MRIFLFIWTVMKGASPLLEIRNLTWFYPWADKAILENFTLSIHTWEMLVIRWRSWVWKTTLSKLLIRAHLPPKDTIYYKKTDIARMNAHEVQQYRQHVGVIFQDNKLLDWKTVWENVVYPLYIQGIDLKERQERGIDILKQCGLYDKTNTYIPHLSWWEKQKVAMARAVIHNPEFVIADEPTWNLDDESWQRIADELIRLNKDGNTIICITHDSILVEYIKTKVNITQLEM
jgi:ABC-type ATPase involved in cell division